MISQLDVVNPQHVTVIIKDQGDETRVTISIRCQDGIDVTLGFPVCNSQTTNDTP